MNTQIEQIKKILEGLLFAADEPLSLEQLAKLLSENDKSFNIKELKPIVKELINDYMGHGIELKEVASGFRFQVREELAPWLNKLWQERPQRYSRALLEVLALIVYKQPITRAEIEEVRGVAVSTNIMRTLLEREWVSVAGYKEVPGRPALYVTTKKFLDYFNLVSLAELPTLDDNSLTSIDIEATMTGPKSSPQNDINDNFIPPKTPPTQAEDATK